MVVEMGVVTIIATAFCDAGLVREEERTGSSGYTCRTPHTLNLAERFHSDYIRDLIGALEVVVKII